MKIMNGICTIVLWTITTLYLSGHEAQLQSSDAEACASIVGLEGLVSTAEDNNLYIGELHGTTESPMLFACLAERLALTLGGRLIVSIEVPPSARHPSARFWSGRDGRSSTAMARLLTRLEVLEGQGLIEIHFQRKDVGQGVAISPRFTAGELDSLSQRGRVIALSGNFHARRAMPAVVANMQSTAMQITEPFLLINIVNIGAGEAWNCANANTCGPRSVIASRMSLNLGLQPTRGDSGSMIGFDSVFAVPRYTASPPQSRRP
jgi:hypothetical protein